jgi:hypothetical protein
MKSKRSGLYSSWHRFHRTKEVGMCERQVAEHLTELWI